MSSMKEIKAAIASLEPREVKELADWLDEYWMMIGAASEIFSLYHEEVLGDLRADRHDLEVGNREAHVPLSELTGEERSAGESVADEDYRPVANPSAMTVDHVVDLTRTRSVDQVLLLLRELRNRLREGDPDTEEAWLKEIQRRLEESGSGKVMPIPVEEALARIREILKHSTAPPDSPKPT
ncbi:MAG: addiction module protein [Verrucomicrobiales bacterium]|nr:addiction module protein [Verrucomicrobiales bacterium]